MSEWLLGSEMNVASVGEVSCIGWVEEERVETGDAGREQKSGSAAMEDQIEDVHVVARSVGEVGHLVWKTFLGGTGQRDSATDGSWPGPGSG